jgi:hypothetical protein
VPDEMKGGVSRLVPPLGAHPAQAEGRRRTH